MLNEIHVAAIRFIGNAEKISPCMNLVLRVGSVHGEFDGSSMTTSIVEAMSSSASSSLLILPHHVRLARSPEGDSPTRLRRGVLP